MLTLPTHLRRPWSIILPTHDLVYFAKFHIDSQKSVNFLLGHYLHNQGRRKWVGRVSICPPSFQQKWVFKFVKEKS